MGSENLVYALIQVVHNFGAAAVLGGALFALWPTSRLEYARVFAWLILLAWGAQIASGLFGLTSLYYYGETPDLSSIAMVALAVKVIAATGGFFAGCQLSGPWPGMESRVRQAHFPEPGRAGRHRTDRGRLSALVFVIRDLVCGRNAAKL